MGKFIVSARKYRPATFNEVVGQPHIVTTLKNAISANHIAHAFLFCGPRGVGKTTCARVLAKVINCEQRTVDVEACNVCASCKSLYERSSFNIYELDAASNNSVDDIRSLVDQMRYAPTSGLYKIYIIDEVHMLSQAAFNAFLKTLEEPPSYAIFILATTEKHKVLPTILSRCQVFDFKPIQLEVMVQQLKNVAESDQIIYDEEALHVISQKSDGSLRDALSMLDVIVSFGAGRLTYEATLETLHILDHNYYLRLVDAFLVGNVQTCLMIYDEVIQSGFDGFYFLEGLMEHIRNVLVAKDVITLPLLTIPLHIKEAYHQQAVGASARFLFEALQSVSQCAMNYKESCNRRFHVELLLVALASKKSSVELPAMLSDQTIAKLSTEKPVTTNGSNALCATVSTASPSTASPSTASPSPSSIVSASTAVPVSVMAGGRCTDTSSIVIIAEEKQPTVTYAQKLSLGTLQYKEVKGGDDRVEVLPTTIKMPQLAALAANMPTRQSMACDVREESYGKKDVVLTVDQLQPFWQTYREQLKLEGKLAGYNLMNRAIEIDGSMIFIKFTNLAEETILDGFKDDLIHYLRKNLSNDVLSIGSKCANNEVIISKPYTAQEKFEYLATKNPLLYQLKTQLALEILN